MGKGGYIQWAIVLIMKPLIFTQKVDKKDPVLGFFHNWISALSEKFEKTSVICLEKGEHQLSPDIKIFSLGKEEGESRLKYIINFYKYIWQERKNYDAVFVHMNQEYILLGGFIWKILGKKIYFWRNHGSGNFMTRVAIALSTKVFCTSKQSFTAKFKKTIIMPVGVDTEIFRPVAGVIRKKYSICMVGRITPLKHIDRALMAVNHLVVSGAQISLSIIGPIADKDLEYYKKLKNYITENNLSGYIFLENAVTQEKLPEIYSSYEICINLSEYGMFDKTILEAAACGTVPLVSNPSLANMPKEMCIQDNSIEGIASSIQRVFKITEQIDIQQKLKHLTEQHNLSTLINKLLIEIK